MRNIILGIIFCCGALIMAPSLSLAENSELPRENELFHQGEQAFRDGDYQIALSLFREAEKEGMDHVSLFYNIGVCAYKLGDYPQARAAFHQVARHPEMASLAYYNLGLTAIKAQDLSAAQKWFRKTAATATDERLETLARTALDRLEVEIVPPWFGFFSFSAGYDDNVKTLYDGDTQTTTGQGDGFTEILLFTRGSLDKERNRLSLQFQAYSLCFTDLDDSNYTSAGLGLLYNLPTGRYLTEAGVDYDFSLVGTTRYAQIPTAFLQFRDNNPQLSLRFSYRFSVLDILDPDYSSLAGTRHTFLAEAGKEWNRFRTRLGYSLEINQRDDADSSPTRHKVHVKCNYKVSAKMKLAAQSSFRRSEYDIADNPDRIEDLFKASLETTYFFSSSWNVGAEYRFERNNSIDTAYDYSRNSIVMNLGVNF
ncbi:tetratricopeptide repeat protein [Thermodesulfobacteriota bacterium]